MREVSRRMLKYSLVAIIVIIFVFVLIATYLIIKNKYKVVYYAEDFGIEVIKSSRDNNNNSVDDYMDIVLGARKDAENKPKYVSKYYARWLSSRK